jgi:NADP-dependent 3-hydroxy acid dehydrogenase YdfG
MIMSQDREVIAGGVAVITGAGAGIGEGLARRASELGMKVVLADISQPRLDALVADLRASGGEVFPIVVDVSKPAELDRLAAAVFSHWGDVRLLINNAGIETIGNSWEISIERWEATLNINLHGVIHGVRAFAPRMLASGKPAWIANLASVGAFSAMPTQTAYILTKHAVEAFSECLYLEMEMTGKPIHVSSIIPGMVKTRIFEAIGGETERATRHRAVMRELMATYGMDLTAASKVILEQVAAGEFWVSTQPDMTRDIVAGRIAFFQDQTKPVLAPQARALLD